MRDEHGPPAGKATTFTIPESVKTDWKENANAGVAVLAQDYKAACKDQPNGTDQTKAQEAYSRYNGGGGARKRYEKMDANGDPANGHDKNFLNNYRAQLEE